MPGGAGIRRTTQGWRAPRSRQAVPHDRAHHLRPVRRHRGPRQAQADPRAAAPVPVRVSSTTCASWAPRSTRCPPTAFRDLALVAIREHSTREMGDADWHEFAQRLDFVPLSAGPLALGEAVARAEELLPGDGQPAAALPLGAAEGRARRRAHHRRGRPRRAQPGRHGEAVRHRLRLGRRAQRPAARGLRRGADLPDRPLPGQGAGAEHPRLPLRQRSVRADLAPQQHLPRRDRRARDPRA